MFLSRCRRFLVPCLLALAAAAPPPGPGAPVLPEPKPAVILPHGKPLAVESLRRSDPVPEDPGVDVLHYDLALAFELDGMHVAGTATVTVVWGSDPDDVLRLDMATIRAAAVRDGAGAPLEYAQDASGLDIRIVPRPVRGDTVTVAVDYAAARTPSYVAHPKSSYTFTEPYGSRAWFPCRDVPWDKATLALHGTCAAGKRVVSNGALRETTDAGNGRTTWHWVEDHPLPPYLVAAYVGDYAVVPFDGAAVTPMTWYVYPEHAEEARDEFANTGAMIAFYDSVLAPWPFDKYVQVEGEFGGGMEHQSCTLVGAFIVTGRKQWEWITAHEAAHHWFGDYVTCRTWDHIWLNEGFATFFEAVWQEDFYGPARFAERMANAEKIVTDYEKANPTHPLVGPPEETLFGSLVYYKGAFILHMLRSLMGREAFDAAVREYLAAHAYGNADTGDLRRMVEKHHGEDLGWFFEQWLYRASGTPTLRYLPRIRRAGEGWEVSLLVLQIQTRAVFRLPLEVRVTTASGAETRTVWLESAREEFALPFDEEPLGVELDPHNRILGRIEPPAASATVLRTGPAVRARPNPFRGEIHLAPAEPGGAVPAEVFDARGRRVAALGLPPGGRVWDGRSDAGEPLPPGVYYIRTPGPGPATRVVLLPR